ncbi:U5 snRNP GTPase SNU114 NDAI_0A00900 [Naumovozyma dairenensis CBS 421]|uniref:Tr-type G domain-containing protein n=1 Tax=Naumovozyma dairenensis (strain ATCC 10597 / BCRC 20456 / CBS 421 / NBRC 0211 / NRRL Y-12639) TaxID=1071378 RepID=G0W360_NAUDC|nr:hypothetical protein NDAI_0A00900 [Naumovozyma dairenensis CBS 421]CCD22248.1 hypothetical protein NDAI_0A00900 [Naumovozyma dairenensis CBS 421]
MDEELFDEFGNIIGQDPFDSDAEDNSSILSGPEDDDKAESIEQDNSAEGEYHEERPSSNALITTDDNHIQELYGDDVEILVETENTQSFNEPIIKPMESRSAGKEHTVFTQIRKNIPPTTYDRNYLFELMKVPERIRNVAIIGPLHSGKTSLVDLLVIESHQPGKLPHLTRNMALGWKQLRYMDNLKQEIERGISIKLNGITILRQDLKGKSIALNLVDSPGHLNFMDETAVSLAACDVAIICLDIVEGVTSITEQLIKQCQRRGLKMLFVLNKLDRLILELKLAPFDTYLKMKHIVQEINSFTHGVRFSPELGNVIFASTKLGFTFTIREFVQYYYSKSLPKKSHIDGFVERLWGDIFYQRTTRTFSYKSRNKINNPKKPQENESIPSFVEFILTPIYKIFANVLANNTNNVSNMLLKNFKIQLDEKYFKYDPQPLLKHILQVIFKQQTGLVQSIVDVYDPFVNQNKNSKLNKLILNPSTKNITNESTFWGHALKTLDYGGSEWTLVRVYKGVLKVGMSLQIIDPELNNLTGSADDDDKNSSNQFQSSLHEVTEITWLCGRYKYEVKEAYKGQIVLVKGISESFTKSATLYGENDNITNIFKPIDYINSPPIFKVALQSLLPKELPKLLDGLDKIVRYYPGCTVKVEESGEQMILGTGELYMDCLLYDLRNVYSQMEIKITDPFTTFVESCSGESFAAIPVKSSDGSISISMGANPMDFQLLQDVVRQKISDNDLNDSKKLSKRLREEYGWDSLAARNVWTFHNGTVLIDDTLPDETDKDELESLKKYIKQGFYWAMKEGPLAEENIFGVQFKLLSVEGKCENKNQIIPLIRKACYVALLTATPILMEPIYEVDIIVENILQPIIEELFQKRRGSKIYKVERIVGSPLLEIKGQIPVIDSVGFETDLRLATNGRAMCQLHFWNKIWRRVPGDVMDSEAPIPKLKPAPINSLSRDFVMKTRRRKGVSTEGFMSNDGPSLEKYIDSDLFKQLKENELI